jgi:phosphoglycolate phosphatase
LSASAIRTTAARARFRVAAVALDLDGTLLDTAADLAAAANAMLAELGRPTLPVSRVADYVGKGMGVLVHRVLSGHPDGRVDDDLHRRASESFLAHYERENGRAARAYPGVRAGLDAMRAAGLRLAVVTNKPASFTATLLALTGLAEYFELVVGGDTLARRKPDPLPMLHVCERFGLEPRQVLAIGDSLNDALAARAAGMPVVLVPYGYNEGRDVRELDVDAIVQDLCVASKLIEPA